MSDSNPGSQTVNVQDVETPHMKKLVISLTKEQKEELSRITGRKIDELTLQVEDLAAVGDVLTN